ncbi:MAG: protein kinase [Acidobacteriia bacterium]|nr:protein kinase [Terriglobia bacterium]
MIGQSIAHYKITAKLGQGGMGEVYRATDTKLDREVALKILPESFAQDPDRMARFQREARVLATLNHPNIAAIYGIEERALVMELVEGETLAGPLLIDTALLYAHQITDALEAAHEKGVIHRDLKPDNIKVTPEGQIKVLDFGLAKAAQETSTPGDPDNSPTMTAAATKLGIIMGTAGYMAPEQARGQAVDKRIDIWSFGVVVFELLTGQRLFKGETVSDTIVQVLSKEPDWALLPAATPPHLRSLLERCLQRDRKKRLRDIGDAWHAPAEAPASTAAPKNSRPWMVAAGLLIAALSVALWNATRPVEQPLIRMDVELGPDARLGATPGISAKLSPDGTRLVFFSETPDGRLRLSTRRLADDKSTPLAGTEGTHDFFFSPDSKWAAFFAQGKLNKVPLDGGSPVTLCDAPQGRGGSWGQDGFIIAALNMFEGLSRVPASGGAPEFVTTINAKTGENTHRWPQILPGDKAVLFSASLAANFSQAGSIEVLSLNTRQRKTLLRGSYYGRYLVSGHLAYIFGNTLYAAPMDVDTLQLTGPGVPVLDEVSSNTFYGRASWEAASTGTLLFQKGSENSGSMRLNWLGKTGKPEPLLDSAGRFSQLRFSPDGHSLAITLVESGNMDIWVHDLKKNSMTRLTFKPENESRPVWTPDGRHIVFTDSGGIAWIPADGSGASQRLLEGKDSLAPASFSPDGKRLAYSKLGDIWTVPIEWTSSGPPRAGKPEPFLTSPSFEDHPDFSPDGRWLAYTSGESGVVEVYVMPAPGSPSKAGGGKWQISKGGGAMSRWSSNGREIFYRSPEQRITALDYEVKGDAFAPGTPRVWSNQRIGLESYRNFDIAPDGNRFAVSLSAAGPDGDKPQTQITVLLNFFDEVRRKIKQSGTQ